MAGNLDDLAFITNIRLPELLSVLHDKSTIAITVDTINSIRRTIFQASRSGRFSFQAKVRGKGASARRDPLYYSGDCPVPEKREVARYNKQFTRKHPPAVQNPPRPSYISYGMR
eukprot:1193526-Prorocentrum_minimum.AAC.3